jgi:hypothetical protein
MATAYISLVHYDPLTTAATGVELVAENGHQKARVYIDEFRVVLFDHVGAGGSDLSPMIL